MSNVVGIHPGRKQNKKADTLSAFQAL